MSKTKTQAKPPRVTSARADAIALVARGDIRESLATLLTEAGIEFTTFDDGDDLLTAPPARTPSLVLIWIEDTTSAMVRAIEPLLQHFDGLPLVVGCTDIATRDVRAALAVGAAGVVLQDNLERALTPCVRAALAGQVCVPREHRQEMDPPVLSSREKQILGLVVMGYTNGKIAEQLFLAESTVKSHLSSAFGKLGVRSRNEAVRVILDPERGLGMGILALGGEPVETASSTAH